MKKALLSILMLLISPTVLAQSPTPQAPFQPDLHTIGLWHMDETEGVELLDASGNGHHATSANTNPVTGQAGFGSARSFAVTPIGALNLGSFTLPEYEGTFEAWIRPLVRPALGADHIHFFVKGNDGNSASGFTFYIKLFNDGRLDAGTGATGGNVWAGWTPPGVIKYDGTWQHIAVVWTPLATKFFVDGIEVAQGVPLRIGQTGDPVAIGKWGASLYPECRYVGDIDEVRISSVARYGAASGCEQSLFVDARADAHLLTNIVGNLQPGELYTVKVTAAGPVHAPMQGLFFMYNDINNGHSFNYTPIGGEFTFRPNTYLPFQLAPLYVDWSTTADNSGVIDVDIIGPTTLHLAIDVQAQAHLITQKIVSGLTAGRPYQVQVDPLMHVGAPMQGLFFMYVNDASEHKFTYVPFGEAFTFKPLNSSYQLAPIYVDWSTVQDNSGSIRVCISPTTELPGIISGRTIAAGEGLAGVAVRLLGVDGTPVEDVEPALSGPNGEFAFPSILPGQYQVMLAEPLGYACVENPKTVVVNSGATTSVDISLTPFVIANGARGKGYWRHQFDAYVTGKGKAQETVEALQLAIDNARTHYSPHFDFFAGLTSFEGWQQVLSPLKSASMLQKATEHLAALVMNLMSMKLGQYTAVTADSRTAGDVLTYVSTLLADDDPANDETAKDIAEAVNNQTQIPAGRVPASSILYKGGIGIKRLDWAMDRPLEYALRGNFPNPFNPSTTVEFEMPTSNRVRIQIFNSLGQEVGTLVDGELNPGRYRIGWNPADLPSGVYFCRMDAGSFRRSVRMLLMK